MMKVNRISTHIPGMDDVFHGGIPENGITLVGGDTGAGKTIFTMQLLSGNASMGAKCIYFTTLSKPLPKLIQYMQTLGFFNAEVIGDRLKFVDLGDAVEAGGSKEAFEVISKTIEAERPDIIAVDSFKVIFDVMKLESETASFAFALSAYLSVWEVSSFLVGEYPPECIGGSPEFSAADNIILFTYRAEDSTTARRAEVLKVRGSDFSSGKHHCEITSEGMRVYHRVGTVEEDEHIESAKRIPSGVPGLDELLHGGIPELSATLIQGGSGIGKTLLGLHFISRAAAQGDKAVIFSFDERPAQLAKRARKLGFDLTGVTIKYIVPIELSASKWLQEARDLVRETGVKRVLIDSLTSMALSMPAQSDKHFKELIYAAVKMFRSMGVTLIMTMEAPSLLSVAEMPGGSVSESTDNIIAMRYVEIESHLKRAIVVVKVRDSSHETDLREFTIGERGIVVGGPFEQFRGVLSGQPTPEE